MPENDDVRTGMSMEKRETDTYLELVQETRIRDLLPGAADTRFEASGVYEKDGFLHIVFDNCPLLLRIRPDWRHAGEVPGLLVLMGTGPGYEDITFHASVNRWYCLIEGTLTGPGRYMPRIDVYDESFAFLGSRWLEFSLMAGNKGFEGLAIHRHAGDDYLLCLCEGNECKTGKEGTHPGKGRIHAFLCEPDRFVHAGTIKLPKAVRFKDYVSLDIRNDSITVISQASSAMWAGHLVSFPESLDDLLDDGGQCLLFPRDERGRAIYCNLEGVAWLDEDRFAVVSDKAKPDQPGRCARKEQSVHIFRVIR